MSFKKVAVVLFILVVLQVVQNDLRLLGKSYKNFTEKKQEFISQLESVLDKNQELLQPYSRFYMEHNNNPELIKNYFATQYVLVPKLISDKPKHSSLPKLQLDRTANNELVLSMLISE